MKVILYLSNLINCILTTIKLAILASMYVNLTELQQAVPDLYNVHTQDHHYPTSLVVKSAQL